MGDEIEKGFDFTHSESKTELAAALRKEGYQLPNDTWHPSAMRAYVKLQGVNFMPDGTIARTEPAAVRIQAAVRRFVIKTIIEKLKAAASLPDDDEDFQRPDTEEECAGEAPTVVEDEPVPVPVVTVTTHGAEAGGKPSLTKETFNSSQTGPPLSSSGQSGAPPRVAGAGRRAVLPMKSCRVHIEGTFLRPSRTPTKRSLDPVATIEPTSAPPFLVDLVPPTTTTRVASASPVLKRSTRLPSPTYCPPTPTPAPTSSPVQLKRAPQRSSPTAGFPGGSDEGGLEGRRESPLSSSSQRAHKEFVGFGGAGGCVGVDLTIPGAGSAADRRLTKLVHSSAPHSLQATAASVGGAHFMTRASASELMVTASQVRWEDQKATDEEEDEAAAANGKGAPSWGLPPHPEHTPARKPSEPLGAHAASSRAARSRRSKALESPGPGGGGEVLGGAGAVFGHAAPPPRRPPPSSPRSNFSTHYAEAATSSSKRHERPKALKLQVGLVPGLAQTAAADGNAAAAAAAHEATTVVLAGDRLLWAEGTASNDRARRGLDACPAVDEFAMPHERVEALRSAVLASCRPTTAVATTRTAAQPLSRGLARGGRVAAASATALDDESDAAGRSLDSPRFIQGEGSSRSFAPPFGEGPFLEGQQHQEEEEAAARGEEHESGNRRSGGGWNRPSSAPSSSSRRRLWESPGMEPTVMVPAVISTTTTTAPSFGSVEFLGAAAAVERKSSASGRRGSLHSSSAPLGGGRGVAAVRALREKRAHEAARRSEHAMLLNLQFMEEQVGITEATQHAAMEVDKARKQASAQRKWQRRRRADSRRKKGPPPGQDVHTSDDEGRHSQQQGGSQRPEGSETEGEDSAAAELKGASLNPNAASGTQKHTQPFEPQYITIQPTRTTPIKTRRRRPSSASATRT